MEAFTLPAEPIQLGKQTYVMKWKHSHCKPSRIDSAWKVNLCYEMEAFTLPAELNRTKPIRLGKQTYVMKWKHSHCQPSQTDSAWKTHLRYEMEAFTLPAKPN
jgi:hypothetical protein